MRRQQRLSTRPVRAWPRFAAVYTNWLHRRASAHAAVVLELTLLPNAALVFSLAPNSNTESHMPLAHTSARCSVVWRINVYPFHRAHVCVRGLVCRSVAWWKRGVVQTRGVHVPVLQRSQLACALLPGLQFCCPWHTDHVLGDVTLASSQVVDHAPFGQI